MGPAVHKLGRKCQLECMYLQSIKSVKHNAAKSVNRSILKKREKPTYRARRLFSSFVHEPIAHLALLCCTVFTIVFIKDKKKPCKHLLGSGKGRTGEGALQESLVEYCYDIFKKPKKYFRSQLSLGRKSSEVLCEVAEIFCKELAALWKVQKTMITLFWYRH
jgi:hypothetical protein